jgi:lipoate-protein ligase A
VDAAHPVTRFRLLVTEPLDGAWNMALDEALLLSRLDGAGPPTLRFFAWSPPTVSVGYGQRLEGGIDHDAIRRLGLGLVRRPTGGSAILHEGPDLELTYSVVAGATDFPGADDLLGTYRWIGDGLCAGLSALGAPVEMVPVQPSDPATMPAFCFARTGSYELEVGGRKLVGSAQRRQGRAFLQHGAIMLGADAARLRRVFTGAADPLGGMTTLEAVLGRRPTFAEVAETLAAGMASAHSIEIAPGGLSEREMTVAAALVEDKYAAADWTRAGRVVTDLARLSAGSASGGRAR